VRGILLPGRQAVQVVVVAGGKVLVVRGGLGRIPVLRTRGRHGGLRLTAYDFKRGVATLPIAHSPVVAEQESVEQGTRAAWP